jgi:protein TonB
MIVTVADRLLDRDRDEHDGSRWTVPRWGLCFAIVAALYVGGAWVAMHWLPVEEPAAAPPPAAVMIDLAPLPTAAPVPPTEVPPGPQQELSEPPPPEPAEPIQPPAPPTVAPEVAVPVPPKPRPTPPKPPERIVHREPPAPRPDKKPPAVATTAPPRVEAPPAPVVAAPAPGHTAASSSNAIPTWQGLLLSRLEQLKRYPSAAQFNRDQGVAYLRFAMDRQGRVLSASIDRSSGFALLDQETLALIHRAEPLPPPPPQVPGNPIVLTVPVRFFLK